MKRWDSRTVAGVERSVRDAALDALADIEPASLRQRIHDEVGGASLVPGAVVLARATTGGDHHLAEGRAAGVQLIYDGLRLTRAIVASNPWDAALTQEDGDLAVLAADVLVARGFYLLADTSVANRAVAVVRTFGRDQTAAADGAGGAQLEHSVFDLALNAAAALVDHDRPPVDTETVAELLSSSTGTPPRFPATLTVLRVISPQDALDTEWDASLSPSLSASSAGE